MPLSLLTYFSRLWRRGTAEIAGDLESGDRIAQLHALRTLATLSGRKQRQLEGSLLRLLDTAEDEVQREARHAMRAIYSLDKLQRRIAHGSPEERAVAVRMLGALRHESTVPLLFEQAASEDEAVRDAAITELVAIGDDRVICSAIETLQRTDPALHGAALHVLRAMGDAAVSLLVGALEAPQREVRFGAVKALEVMHARQACPQLVPLLDDPVEEIRAQAARVLAAMRYREALPDLVMAVNDPAQSVRVEAATALAVLGEPEAVDGLLDFLRRCSEDMSFEVADQDFLAAIAAMPDLPPSGYLIVLKGENQPFAVSLAVGLEDAGTVNRWLLSIPEVNGEDRRVLVELLETVAELGVREPFVEGLSLPDPELRGFCAWLLGRCRHRDAVPVLIGLLSDTTASVRRRAVEALGVMEDGACARALSDALGDPDRETREAAVAALAGMIETGAISAPHTTDIVLAEEAPPAQLPGSDQLALPEPRRSTYSLPARVSDVLGGLARTSAGASGPLSADGMLSGTSALLRSLHDPADNVRAQVSEALGRLGIDSAAHDLLDRALHDRSPEVRTKAARALAKLNASEVAPALIKSLQHNDSELRRRAAEALGELGDPLAGSALIAALEDPSPPVRHKAARALWQIADASLIEPLREHLHNPDPRIRAAITGVFGKLHAVQALDAVASRLEDPNKYVRASALNALANMGEDGRGACQRAVRLLTDSDSFVRARAAEALAKMGYLDDDDMRALLGALDDPAEDVRAVARASLLDLANSGAVMPMVQALTDDDHYHHVRSILVETNLTVMRGLLTTARQVNDNIGRMLLDIVSQVLRERGSIEDCRRDLMSLDPTVRLAGLEALAILRTSEAIDLIAEVLFNDPLPALREKAADVLGQLEDPAALAALKRARDVIPRPEANAAPRLWSGQPGAG
ncbi:MAG: HEAT repeat domain-containing protein [Armatimonadota bacterium]|nr:MAG: HEAT repeat domain-containing protein [Armatimonadota bacterium]